MIHAPRSHRRRLLAIASSLPLVAWVACSHDNAPVEPQPPAYVAIEVGWTASSVTPTEGGFLYTFGFTATAEQPGDAATPGGKIPAGSEEIAGLTYTWSVDRLLPAETRSEIPLTETREGTAVVMEPAGLEESALLVITVQARIGELVSPPISRVLGHGLIGPRTRITSPALPEGRGPTSLPVTIRWSAWDEGPVLGSSAAVPASFSCKLVPAGSTQASEEEIRALLESETNLLVEDRDTREWTVLPSDRHDILNRRSPSSFVFAVRAVAPDGTREPLELGRNVVLGTYRPTILDFGVFDASGETLYWDDDDDPVRVARVEGSVFELSWEDMVYCRYATGSDDDSADWRGVWAWRSSLDAPLILPEVDEEAGAHHVFLHYRVSSGRPETERRVDLRIELLSSERRGFLIVDDTDSELWSDAALDAHDLDVLAAGFAERGTVDRFDLDDEWFREPVPTAVLAKYEGVLWHTHYLPGYFGASRLARSLAAVRSYLRSGGRLFLVGGPVSDLTRDDIRVEHVHPKDPPGSAHPDWEATSLLTTELGVLDVLGGVPSEGTSEQRGRCGLIGAEPITDALPRLLLDPEKWDAYAIQGGEFRGGIPFWEGLWKERGWLDSRVGVLYYATTFDTTRAGDGEGCAFSGAAIAFRNAIPAGAGSPLPEGRVVVFDFETYVFVEAAVAEAAGTAIEWLLQEQTGRP